MGTRRQREQGESTESAESAESAGSIRSGASTGSIRSGASTESIRSGGSGESAAADEVAENASSAAADEVDEIVAAWQRERPDLDVAPLHVLSRLDRLAGVLGERRAAIFAGHDLRRHEFDVLAALRRSGEPFQLTAGELALRTHVTSGTMTSRLDGLTARGLVTRTPDRADGRLVRVGLTADGRAQVDAAFADLVAAERELLAPLPRDTIGPLAEALRALLARADTT